MPQDSTYFEEGHVDAEGGRVRYRSAGRGEGPPLVHLPGDRGIELTPAHELLARDRRVIALEATEAGAALAAVTGMGIETFDLLGSSTGGRTALRLAVQAPERLSAVVLESPEALVPHRDQALEGAMRGLQVPVLVLFGAGDALMGPQTGGVYRRLLPNCHQLFVYRAGPAISSDRPEAFVEAVTDFLAHHEQFVVSRRSTVLFP